MTTTHSERIHCLARAHSRAQVFFKKTSEISHRRSARALPRAKPTPSPTRRLQVIHNPTIDHSNDSKPTFFALTRFNVKPQRLIQSRRKMPFQKASVFFAMAISANKIALRQLFLKQIRA
ncbi:MAG: hypothetical protein ACREMT_10960, partial [Vulcanimicrobiaceae bacterium]